jgi:GTP-binding protein Era
MEKNKTYCGLTAIIGEPNAGKSTLVNRLVGSKISIVTPKVQTTRYNVRGVAIHEHAQLVFIDTPGIFAGSERLEKAMVNAAWSGVGEADAVVFLVDARKGMSEKAQAILAKLKKYESKSLLLVINKIDLVPKVRLMQLAKEISPQAAFSGVYMISALKDNGVDDLRAALASKMPEGPWLFPEDELTDQSMRNIAAEVTREKLFMALGNELPYASFVATESWEEKGELIKIGQTIFVEREGQKKIVLGAGGEKIKSIGIKARKELEHMTGKKIHLALFVKVKPKWKDNKEFYQAMGLEF